MAGGEGVLVGSLSELAGVRHCGDFFGKKRISLLNPPQSA